MRANTPRLLVTVLLAGLLALASAPPAQAPGDTQVYADALGSGWSDWSWSTAADFASHAQAHDGTSSLAVTYQSAWAGHYLHADPTLDGSGFVAVRFWIHGGTAGGQRLRLFVYRTPSDASDGYDVTATAGVWQQVQVPLAALGGAATISGLVWQDTTGGAQPTFYLDDIALVAGTATPTPTPPTGSGPLLAIDAGAGLHRISPDIYGMNYADEALAAELRLPVRRWGGNSTSRYNWQADVHNTGSDWYFENVPEDNPNPSLLPNGSAADRFVEQDRRTGTRTLLTVPLIGWTPKRRLADHPFDCGFKVSKYGAQQSTDPWDPDCGNGVYPNGADVTGNDPSDTSAAIDPSFVSAWVQHLAGRYGTAAAGGVRYYDLDNEPMLWNSTHRDVHPQPTSYDELRDRTFAYAAAVKAADPGAATLGPVLWGWTAYFWSALDAAPGGSWWNHPADRLAHGDVPFVEWYLQQMRAYQQQHGTRILDYCDVHFYPPTVALEPAGGAATQALRLRSTRLLWDRNYTEESWIAQPVYLVPRMHEWVSADYPGTKLALTEYNWGALDSINGALAQADVLGIFGREGLDLATLWGPPASSDPGAFAFRMYRNADGAGHGFGETAVRATSSDEGRLSAYAARREGDGALTVMVINKTGGGLTSTISLFGFTPAAPAQVWRYSADDLGAIAHLPDVALAGASLTTTFPASSITLLVVPAATVTPTPTPTLPPDDPTQTTQWTDCGWNYRKSITIDHTKVLADQKDFPVLINVNSDPSLATHAQTSGKDFLFTLGDMKTKVPHKIETFT
ncbi:MAG TPA: glycoside hydrolase family 44 protein, partial [Thermoanaerobaculaceae bacterium]|nr:glycoside hydrolase family 44 protein [Thermoanaerobaculaceae bacterium]